VAGVLTIGYGYISAAGAPKVTPGIAIGDKKAEPILKADLAKFEAWVERLVKVPLTDNQFVALVSFDFNIGALHKSTLLKKLNKGDYAAVPGELMKWVNAGWKEGEGPRQSPFCRGRALAKGEFASSNYVPATTAANKTDVTTIGGAGAAAAAVTVGSVIPELVSTISNQHDELSSGQWVRVAIAAVIIGLTLWGVYWKIKS